MTSSDASSAGSLSPDTNRQRRPARWLIAGGLGILLLGGGWVVWQVVLPRLLGGPPAQQMPPGVPVTLAPVQSGRIEDSSQFLGSLEAQSGVALQPEVSGRVTQVYLSSGETVSAGTPIVLISPERTQAELNAAQASVTAARAARETAQAELRSARSDSRELEAELVLAEADYQRTERLVEQGVLPEQDLDAAQRDLDVARASLAAAEDDVAAAQSSLNQAEATLEQAIANQAAAQQNLQDRTVVAPIDGVVGDIPVKLGDYVSPNTVITTVTQNETLELDIAVPVDRRQQLSLGLPVELLSGNDAPIATGSITFIAPQATADTQTVLVTARFNNESGRLQDAQRVNARIIWSQTRGLLVPTSAITRLGGETFVYVAEKGSPEALPPPEAVPPNMPRPTQVARLQPVELGELQGNSYPVLDGLEAGDTIVVSGILNLQDGTPILPQNESSESSERSKGDADASSQP